jgi:hypothetical protein
MINLVEDFLQAPFTYRFDNKKYSESLTITDTNKIQIKIMYNWWFHQGAIITDPQTGQYTLHNSDPEKAHEICHSKDCHHFENGRLYKCGPAALFPVFDQQMGLTLSESDRHIMNSLNSIGIEDSFETKQQFLSNINQPIDQCKFCPQTYQGQQIYAQEKKIKVFK